MHKRRLAESLEVLAENAACYGHTMLATQREGGGDGEDDGKVLVEDSFRIADEACEECLTIWEQLGDDGKLADALIASAAVDFYK